MQAPDPCDASSGIWHMQVSSSSGLNLKWRAKSWAAKPSPDRVCPVFKCLLQHAFRGTTVLKFLWRGSFLMLPVRQLICYCTAISPRYYCFGMQCSQSLCRTSWQQGSTRIDILERGLAVSDWSDWGIRVHYNESHVFMAVANIPAFFDPPKSFLLKLSAGQLSILLLF